MIALLLAAALPAAAAVYDDRWVSFFGGENRVSWRLLDPVTGLATDFLELDAFPRNIQWSPASDRVLFRLGAEVHEAPWRPGSKSRIVADLPGETRGLDVALAVSSQTGRLRAGVLIPAPEERFPAGLGTPFRARVWEREPGGAWTLIRDELTNLGTGNSLGWGSISEALATDWISADRPSGGVVAGGGGGESFDPYAGLEKVFSLAAPCAKARSLSRNGHFLIVADRERSRCAGVVNLKEETAVPLPPGSRRAFWANPFKVK